MIPFKYNFRNLTVRRTTTIAAAAGLALVVYVFASVLMLSNGLEKTLGRTAKSDVAIVVRKGSEEEFSSLVDEPHLGIIGATEGVSRSADGLPLCVGEVLGTTLLDRLGTDGLANVSVRGVPDRVLALRSSVKVIEGRPAKPGTDEVIVGKAIRGRFKGLDVGQSFDLAKNRPVKVVGIFDDNGSSFDSEVWGDLNIVRTAFGKEGFLSSARVKLDSPAKFDAFKASLESNRQLDLEALRESDYFEKQSHGMRLFITTMGMLIAVFFSIGAMIGAMITMHASIASREREIGTLRALGFSRFQILVAFLLESTMLALIGGGVGAIAALTMGLVRVSAMNPITWSEIVFTFEPTVGIIAGALAFAIVMGLLGGMAPALRAARMNPIVAMRG